MQKQELIRSVVEMVGLNIMEKSMAYNLIEKITLNEKQSKYKTILRGEDKPLVKRNDRKTKHPKWSEEDTNFLKENYANFSGKEIGAKLNRTRQSINQRVLFLRKTGVDIPKKIGITTIPHIKSMTMLFLFFGYTFGLFPLFKSVGCGFT